MEKKAGCRFSSRAGEKEDRHALIDRKKVEAGSLCDRFSSSMSAFRCTKTERKYSIVFVLDVGTIKSICDWLIENEWRSCTEDYCTSNWISVLWFLQTKFICDYLKASGGQRIDVCRNLFFYDWAAQMMYYGHDCICWPAQGRGCSSCNFFLPWRGSVFLCQGIFQSTPTSAIPLLSSKFLKTLPKSYIPNFADVYRLYISICAENHRSPLSYQAVKATLDDINSCVNFPFFKD